MAVGVEMCRFTSVSRRLRAVAPSLKRAECAEYAMWRTDLMQTSQNERQQHGQ